MFKSITYILAIANIGYAKFAFPDNTNFDINYYNNSNCFNYSFDKSTIQTLCLEGRDKCCNKMLSEIGFDSQNKFGVCYPISMGNSSIKSVKYECNMAKYQGMTASEVFSIIGLVMSVLFVMFIVIYTVYKCCLKNSSGYSNI